MASIYAARQIFCIVYLVDKQEYLGF